MASDRISLIFGKVVDYNGVLHAIKFAPLNASAGTSVAIAAVSGKQITVIGIDFTFTAAGTVGWNSAASIVRNPQSFATNGGVQADYQPGWYVQTALSEALNVVVTNGPIVGGLLYIEL